MACEKYRNCSHFCVFHMLVLHDVYNVLITSCPHTADMMFCLQGTGGFIGWSCFSVVGPCPVMPSRFSLYPSCCPLHKKTLTCPPWTRAGSMLSFSLVSTLGCESLINSIWMGWTAPLFYFYSCFFFFLSSGMMIGGYFWGSLADRHGRRTVLLGSLTVNGLGGLVSSTSQVFWLFLLARFISGIG